jgi:hypothetical protein
MQPEDQGILLFGVVSGGNKKPVRELLTGAAGKDGRSKAIDLFCIGGAGSGALSQTCTRQKEEGQAQPQSIPAACGITILLT